MKFPLFLVAATLLFAPLFAPSVAQFSTAQAAPVKIRTPKAGSAERTAILNALRVPVTRLHKGKRITFTRVEMRAGGGWVHVRCQATDAQNRVLKYPGSGLSNISALLRYVAGKNGKFGSWRVAEWAYAGDVIEIGWAKKYPSVPKAVLGLTR